MGRGKRKGQQSWGVGKNGKDGDDGWSRTTPQGVHHDHPIGIGELKKPEKNHPQHRWTNEIDWERGAVAVAVIVENEEDREGEQGVATQFHPAVGHDPFTVISSK